MAKKPAVFDETVDLEAGEVEGLTDDEQPILYRICRELIAEHELVKPAAAALLELAQANDELYNLLMHNALERRCELAIRQVMGQQRRAVWQRTARSGAHHKAMASIKPSVVAAWAEEVRVGLLDKFTLPDGTPLRTATREQVMEAADKYRTAASAMAGRAVFLELVGQSLQPGEVVGDRISDARAVELQNMAITEYAASEA